MHALSRPPVAPRKGSRYATHPNPCPGRRVGTRGRSERPDDARNVFTADQIARYQQLQFQFGGFNSLNDPVAQKALNLTDAQVAQLKQDIAWAAQQQAAIQQAALTDRTRALELSNAFNTASQ